MAKDPKIPHLLTKNTKPPRASFFILFLLGRGVLAVSGERVADVGKGIKKD